MSDRVHCAEDSVIQHLVDFEGVNLLCKIGGLSITKASLRAQASEVIPDRKLTKSLFPADPNTVQDFPGCRFSTRRVVKNIVSYESSALVPDRANYINSKFFRQKDWPHTTSVGVKTSACHGIKTISEGLQGQPGKGKKGGEE